MRTRPQLVVGLQHRVVEEDVDPVAREVLERRRRTRSTRRPTTAWYSRTTSSSSSGSAASANAVYPRRSQNTDGHRAPMAGEQLLALGRRHQRGDLRRQEPRQLLALALDRREQPGVVVAQPLVGERRRDAGLEQRRLDRPRAGSRRRPSRCSGRSRRGRRGPRPRSPGSARGAGLAWIAASAAKPSSSGITRSSSTTSIPAPSVAQQVERHPAVLRLDDVVAEAAEQAGRASGG